MKCFTAQNISNPIPLFATKSGYGGTQYFFTTLISKMVQIVWTSSGSLQLLIIAKETSAPLLYSTNFSLNHEIGKQEIYWIALKYNAGRERSW